MAGVALLHRRHLFGRAFRHHHAALDAAFGAEVDDPVGGLDDVEIMLDHDHVALLDKPVEHPAAEAGPGLPFSSGTLDGLQQRLLALRAALAAVARDFRDASFLTTTFDVGGEVRERDSLSLGF